MKCLNLSQARSGFDARPTTLLSLVLPFAMVLSFGILHGQDTAQALAATAVATHTGHDAEVITPERLSQMMDSAKVYVFDCNEPDMFDEAHVPGAVLTVYDEVSEKNLPSDHQAMIVFYCYSPECPAGSNAARTALKLGHTHVYSMLAGITGWQDAKLKTEP
jgi:rhodanese-related sulfurtransferase